MNYKLIFTILLLTHTLNAHCNADDLHTIDEVFLAKVVEEQNKGLPITLDRNTRWVTTSAGPGLRITNFYKIVTARANELDKSAMYQTMGPILRNKVCTDPDMALFLKKGVSFSYLYHGSDGGYITQVDITPHDCNLR